LTCLLGVAAAGDVAAQEPRDTVELEELSVTATRVPVSANAVTASVDVITGAELRARGVAFVTEALAELPSATVVQGGGIGGVAALFLRGGESDYVKVLVDGVPVNEAGGAFNFANLTTDNVERIEVVRGPVSVLYGADAVSGIVQIFTRRGGGPAALSGALEGGTDATARWNLSAAGGSEALEWSAGVSRLRTDGMYEFNNEYGNTVLSGRVGVRPDRVTGIALTARYSDARAAFPTDFTGAPADSNQVTSGRQLAAGLDAGRYLTDIVEARATVSISRGETGFDDQPDHPGDDSGFGYRSERTTAGTRAVVDGRLNIWPSAGLVVTLGAAYEREAEDVASETESDFGSGPFVETSTFDERRRTAGVYAQAVADLASGLALTLNARLDENSAFGTFRTARAGLAYRMASGTRLRGSAGTAYKAPTFCEQFCDQPFIVGDPGLAPERVATWEVAAEQLLAGGAVTIAATWFAQRFEDRIEYVAAAPAEPNYANLSAARARGLELAATASPAPGIRVRAGYTWLDTEITDGGGNPALGEGEPLLRRPAHTVTFTGSIAAGERTTLTAGVVRVGARDDTDFQTGLRGELPAYVTVGAALSATLVRASGASPSVAVTLRGENIFDERYHETFGFPGRGRMVFAGVRAGF
jgi:vitamin B12 transporter